MEDPAVAADGYTYERTAIECWLSEHDTSPVTGKALETKVVFKNWSLVSSSPSPSFSSEPGR
ncbi:protein kinase [Ectocarpus siliculosus]|uniref:Protein kinase n=1 Tax=Ectocarpus siliculosus TaxID=2880 RepID=D7G3T4_ECTSI|nr:protein kinase [Ectocarpus siliculosus]|eukprot:CBJ33611.1 protein kinase [Ectocarpus siliculosus]